MRDDHSTCKTQHHNLDANSNRLCSLAADLRVDQGSQSSLQILVLSSSQICDSRNEANQILLANHVHASVYVAVLDDSI
jgi:hypothetical protein